MHLITLAMCKESAVEFFHESYPAGTLCHMDDGTGVSHNLIEQEDLSHVVSIQLPNGCIIH